MISFVYFDIGGVVVIDFSGHEEKWQALQHELGITPQNERAYRAIWDKYLPQVCTTCDTTTLLQAFKQELGLQLPDDYSLLDAFVRRFEPNPSIGPVVAAIKQAVPVGLLTNMYIGMLPAIQKADILPDTEWDVVIDSSVELCQKPEKEIFQLAEQRAGVPSKHILFVDNSAEHVEAAKQLGWQTYLYDTANPERSSQELLQVFLSGQKA